MLASPQFTTPLQPGDTHRMRIRVEGARQRVWIDDLLAYDGPELRRAQRAPELAEIDRKR